MESPATRARSGLDFPLFSICIMTGALSFEQCRGPPKAGTRPQGLRVMSSNPILHEDLARIHAVIGPRAAGRFQDATVVITGCAGFLGYYFIQYFLRHA